MHNAVSRRTWLAGTTALATGTVALSPGSADAQVAHRPLKVRYCLNTSTIRGQKRSLPEEIEICRQVGYDGMEPWMREIDQYQQTGGSLSDLRKRIEDAGLTIDSAIGFCRWIVDDEDQRREGLERMKRDMDALRQIGGTRIAAPPVGATDNPNLDLALAAERYADLVRLGRQMEVKPELELWGFSKSLSRLGELMYVAVESGQPDACLLPDVYHIYKGGSDFAGLRLINGTTIEVMHINDYPAIARSAIADKDRVYPGDGDAPLQQILGYLADAGFAGTFSLELFNPHYWQQDPLLVAQTGLEKMKAIVARANDPTT